MSFELSEGARHLLKSCGWHEGRRVATEPLRGLLEGRGFEVHAAGESFLAEFHGLRLRPPQGALAFVSFDVAEELGWIEEEDRPFLDSLSAEPLCPVGHGGGALLLLTRSGGMVILDDQWFACRLIPTVPEAMDFIFGLRRFPEYPAVPVERSCRPPGLR